MRVQLMPGEKVTVCTHDADHEFEIEYGKDGVSISTEIADDHQRKGTIYHDGSTKAA